MVRVPGLGRDKELGAAAGVCGQEGPQALTHHGLVGKGLSTVKVTAPKVQGQPYKRGQGDFKEEIQLSRLVG